MCAYGLLARCGGGGLPLEHPLHRWAQHDARRKGRSGFDLLLRLLAYERSLHGRAKKHTAGTGAAAGAAGWGTVAAGSRLFYGEGLDESTVVDGR